MPRGRPSSFNAPQVSIRVILPRDDYDKLKEMAMAERSDIGTLVRRAIARCFFMPGNSNSINTNT